MNSAILHIRSLRIAHGKRQILHIEQLDLPSASFTAIIGPNGAGKSSLLQALSGSQAANAAHIFHQGKSLNRFRGIELAQRRAMLSQHSSIAFALSVEALVQLGREPYRHQPARAHDKAVCTWALNAMSLSEFKERSSHSLSGGEQHRAHIARVLAQLLPSPDADLSGKWLLLDEPTNHLDIHHQYQLFAELQRLKARGLSIIAILHDPALALNQADHIILLKAGKLFAQHNPAELANNHALDALYDMQMRCRYCPQSQQYYLAPTLG